MRGWVLNRKSFRDHSPIGWEKWIFGSLRLDVKNSCACALTLPFYWLWYTERIFGLKLVVYKIQIVGSKFKN